jgi:hypothetical protein
MKCWETFWVPRLEALEARTHILARSIRHAIAAAAGAERRSRASSAGVAELVDAAGLGPAAARCGGSSPSARTIHWHTNNEATELWIPNDAG